jgi:hypothetical protein
MRRIRFSITPAKSQRVHYVNKTDIEVVLSRLPPELWGRLRGVHFNDRSFGFRTLGYVNRGRHDIALCALPFRLTLNMYCRNCEISPSEFGATWGAKWPALAVRCFMLYEVFLHDVGHLQVFDARRRSRRLRFYREKLAQGFATWWRERLWSFHFDHPDPVHNPPEQAEIGPTNVARASPQEQPGWSACRVCGQKAEFHTTEIHESTATTFHLAWSTPLVAHTARESYSQFRARNAMSS